jgi:hypothetical protein
MGTTISEAIQRVQSLYSKGVQSGDSRLSARQIYSVLKGVRADLLAQQDNKKQSIPSSNYQTLYIDLEHHKLPNTTKPILRSKSKLPKIVSSIKGFLISFITSPDGFVSYDLVDFRDTVYSEGNKFTSGKIKVYLKDDYLFVAKSSQIKQLSLVAILEDPLADAGFSGLPECEECLCEDLRDHDFYLDTKTLKTTIQLASQELLSMFSQMENDKLNNASDDKGRANVRQPQQEDDN